MSNFEKFLLQLLEFVSSVDVNNSSDREKLLELSVSAFTRRRALFFGKKILLAEKDGLFFPEDLKVVSPYAIEERPFSLFRLRVRDYEKRLERMLSAPEKALLLLYEFTKDFRPEIVVVTRDEEKVVFLLLREGERAAPLKSEVGFFADIVDVSVRAAFGLEIPKERAESARLSSALLLFLLEETDFEPPEETFERIRPEVLIRSPRALEKVPPEIRVRVLEKRVRKKKLFKAL